MWEILKAAGILGGIALTWWKIVPPIVLWFKKIYDKRQERKQVYKTLLAEVEILRQFREAGALSISELNEVLKAIMVLQNLAFWFSDKDGKCIYASPGLCKMLGRVESDIEQDNWSVWITDQYRDKVWVAWESFMGHDKMFNMKYAFTHGIDGSTVDVLGRALKIKPSGIIVGVLYQN